MVPHGATIACALEMLAETLPFRAGSFDGDDKAPTLADARVEETAEVLKVSPDTVLRDWRLAKAWLAREMGKAVANGNGA